MANSSKSSRRPRPSAPPPGTGRRSGPWILIGTLTACLVAAAAIVAIVVQQNRVSNPTNSSGAASADRSGKPAPTATASASKLPQMEVKQAVMVTVELDFGPKVPSIAEALKEIERRHQPDDGVGRVFSILDAYGEPTADGRKLHMQMHVSSEKLGVGSLIFRRTGEVLWSNRIVPAADGTTSVRPTGLTILLDDGAGHVFTVDGSTNPESLLQASLKESGQLIDQAWPEGAEREVTFLYSACGCPVKVKCRRSANRIVRTSDMPVIFPDDPAAVEIINRLMGW